MSAHVPSGARIVYDYLSYVPPAFTNVTATWGGTRDWLASVDPDIVVVNRTASPLWQGPGNAESYTPCLDDGACGYVRVFTRNPIAIFQKRKS